MRAIEKQIIIIVMNEPVLRTAEATPDVHTTGTRCGFELLPVI